MTIFLHLWLYECNMWANIHEALTLRNATKRKYYKYLITVYSLYLVCGTV